MVSQTVLDFLVGRLAERRYQLAAQKRNDTAQKFDYYVKTANYFERESGKAKQFNSWNIDKVKPIHWENIKKAETLHRRQSQLQELLKSENEVYQREIEESRPRKDTNREQITLEALKEKLRQKRAEQSLYHPRTCRRIQSYFTYPTKDDPAIIKEPSRKSLENTNLRNDMQSSHTTQDSPQKSKMDFAKVDFTNLADQASFNVRHQEFMDNRAASNRSNFGVLSASKYSAKNGDSSGRSSASTYERSDFLDHGSNGDDLLEGWNLPKKFADRYAKQSLQETNVRETGPTVKPNETEQDTTDNASIDHDISYSDKQNGDSPHSAKEDYIANKMKSVHLHLSAEDDAEKDETWMPQSSDTMLMYLTHQEVKKKIQDLESRELKAIHKQFWEEALRLKDMKNRLELFRDRQFYMRDDIRIDPDLKQLAISSIEARTKQLATREEFCVNSQMYSEEAKLMWNIWAEEDKKHFIKDEKDEREMLMHHLEKEWEVLQQEEKQKTFYNYMQIINKSFTQHQMELLAKLTQQKF